ncbi:MAG TPA: serine/threonine-protein kinase, partial [Gemmataceae bacterium]|nr:serine/threonine-protein kinase [Gemmataceae bacterium]
FPIPSLGDTLMPSDNNHEQLEIRLRRAKFELERRIPAGEECSAEEYFKADPELAADVDSAIDLVYTEYTARKDAGRPLPPEHYYGQHAQLRNKLEPLFLLDDEFDESHPTRVIRILGADGQREQYQVLKEISQSPNGNIDKAQHVSQNRLVAIKTLAGGDQADVQRFQFGAREQQRLRHDNILPVYCVGESEDGHPCFSMEFADGGSLDQRIAGKPQPPREAAQLVRTLARAMSYAHGASVVHRDLKPANVVLTADGVPMITDFGLARRVDATNGQDKTGDILGTVPYMAPEQAAGRTREANELCDVYALGGILYELLTGRPPFKGGAVVEDLQQILKQPPVRPRRLLRGVPPGLESICLKCLEKKPRRRYRSAQELADDLGRWLDDKRPEAHSRWARVSRFLRRRPILYTAVALLLFAGMSAAIIVPIVRYYRDPDRVVKDYLAELERGNSVTLIGATGEPRWQKLVIGKGSIVPSPANDGVFSVSASQSHDAYWELLPVSRARGCRFRVQVRVDLLRKDGAVGVLFARTDFPVAAGTEHCYCVLVISEFNDKLIPDLKIVRGLVPGRQRVPVSAERTHPHEKRPLPDPREPRWRQVKVEITHDAIRGWVDEQFVGNVDRRQLPEFFQRECNSKHAALIYDPSLNPTFPPAGGLGVFVQDGWGSFRNAVVEPLDN